jgi:hypothetical protein
MSFTAHMRSYFSTGEAALAKPQRIGRADAERAMSVCGKGRPRPLPFDSSGC